MVHIDVHLNPNADGKPYFTPGQTLSGVVELHLEKQAKFRGLFIIINGAARAHWTKRELQRNNYYRKWEPKQIKYESVITYLNQRTYLFGHQNAEPIEMAPGVYKYNFSVQLPHGIPASLAGSHGNILYKYEVRLDIPWASDKEVKSNFIVMRHDDLRQYPDLRSPLRPEKTQRLTFCSIFCTGGGSCNVTVSLPHSGFAVGKTIPIKIDYENHGGKYKVKRTKIALKRIFVYNAQSKHHGVDSKFEEQKVLEVIGQGVDRNQTKTVICEMELPLSLPTSSEKHCNVIFVRYEIEVTCVSTGCDKDIQFRFPIVIGNVAFDGELEYNGMAPAGPSSYPGAPMTNMFPPPNAPLLEGYSPQAVPLMGPSAHYASNDIPPSFEETSISNQKMFGQNEGVITESVGWNVPSNEKA